MTALLSLTNKVRSYSYPLALFLIYLLWTSYMFLFNRWHIFTDWWPMSLTMVLGSFVAGASAEGVAAVAFPVFTKALHIPAGEARTFGLMIQSIGMTMASLVILTRRIKILPCVIGWISLGGIVGMVVGSLIVPIPPPYPKILFTFVTAAFGMALVLSRWVIKWQPHNDFRLDRWPRHLLFVAIGIVGGVFAAPSSC
jgi:uncharacterized protein